MTATNSTAEKAKDKAKRPPTWDHLRSQKKATTRVVKIYTDSEKLEEYEKSLEEYNKLNGAFLAHPEVEALKTERDEAERRLEVAKTDLETCTLKFVMRSIGRRRFEEIMSAHPAKPEQIEKARAKMKAAGKDDEEGELAFDPDEFPPHLLAACMAEPELTIEEAQELWDSDEWNEPETTALFMAAMAVNHDSRQVDLGKGLDLIRNFVQS